VNQAVEVVKKIWSTNAFSAANIIHLAAFRKLASSDGRYVILVASNFEKKQLHESYRISWSTPSFLSGNHILKSSAIVLEVSYVFNSWVG